MPNSSSDPPRSTSSVQQNETAGEQQHDALLSKMEAARQQWMEDDGDDADDTDRFLQEAMDLAVRQGKGWAPGEKEEYMKRILDDDFIPPIFCSTPDEAHTGWW
jgi:hypothetical protein